MSCKCGADAKPRARPVAGDCEKREVTLFRLDLGEELASPVLGDQDDAGLVLGLWVAGSMDMVAW